MAIKEVKSITIRTLFGPPAPDEAPLPYVIASLPGDPPGSFTIFSARSEDVLRSNNLREVRFGVGRHALFAIMAYATSYEGLCAALDLLNTPTQAEQLLAALKAEAEVTP